MKDERRIGFHRMPASEGDQVVDVASRKQLAGLLNDPELPLPDNLDEDHAQRAEGTLCSRTTYIYNWDDDIHQGDQTDLRNLALSLTGEQHPGSGAPQRLTGSASQDAPRTITEFVPETQHLQEICGAVGIPDWEDLSMNEHQHLRTVEPSQVIDAFAVHLKSNSAPHCALLANECGSGKTNTVMAGIEMSVRIRQQGLADESVRAPGLARSWKMMLWLCPSSILSQRCAEMSDFYGGLFKVYCSTS
ncbi:hypothetical protein CDV31_000798 [Fusarium ambrosium]|uniref:SNF2 N-terminal domain-containing protein n=1 Tax=Fusarium ambrosium TaxID=131363 RepID=A0A428V174_9HYPO|nr:hypothetical protein CDV31_000798 [Fusarium ambrosium]